MQDGCLEKNLQRENSISVFHLCISLWLLSDPLCEIAVITQNCTKLRGVLKIPFLMRSNFQNPLLNKMKKSLISFLDTGVVLSTVFVYCKKEGYKKRTIKIWIMIMSEI